MSQIFASTCDRCGEPLSAIQIANPPVEPMYELKVAVMLIPMPFESLRKLLTKHPDKFPKRYRLEGRGHRRKRLLSSSEIRLARAMALRGEAPRITAKSTMKALLN